MHKVTSLFLMEPHIRDLIQIEDCLTSNGANTVKIIFKTFLVPINNFSKRKNTAKISRLKTVHG